MALTAKYPSDEKERGIVRDFASTYVDALMARRQAERRRSVLKGEGFFDCVARSNHHFRMNVLNLNRLRTFLLLSSKVRL